MARVLLLPDLGENGARDERRHRGEWERRTEKEEEEREKQHRRQEETRTAIELNLC